jgi:hypothetical protein
MTVDNLPRPRPARAPDTLSTGLPIRYVPDVTATVNADRERRRLLAVVEAVHTYSGTVWGLCCGRSLISSDPDRCECDRPVGESMDLLMQRILTDRASAWRTVETLREQLARAQDQELDLIAQVTQAADREIAVLSEMAALRVQLDLFARRAGEILDDVRSVTEPDLTQSA